LPGPAGGAVDHERLPDAAVDLVQCRRDLVADELDAGLDP
jgi:hypothetical protein